jgi:hypothetical protein
MCKECGAGEIISIPKAPEVSKPLVIQLGPAHEVWDEANQILESDLAEVETPREYIGDLVVGQVDGNNSSVVFAIPEGKQEAAIKFAEHLLAEGF